MNVCIFLAREEPRFSKAKAPRLHGCFLQPPGERRNLLQPKQVTPSHFSPTGPGRRDAFLNPQVVALRLPTAVATAAEFSSNSSHGKTGCQFQYLGWEETQKLVDALGQGTVVWQLG